MAAARRRRRLGRADTATRTTARIPERPLNERVLDLAAPLLERMGAAPPVDALRDAVALAIAFWNAKARAAEVWGPVESEPLAELQERMTGEVATAEDSEAFALLAARWREEQLAFDPRLVGEWSLDIGAGGELGLSCAMELPPGVEAEVPPPLEERIAIGGQFLDEVQLPMASRMSLLFPRKRHTAMLGEGGTLTLRTPMPVAVVLLADGVLPPKGGAPVEVLVHGENLGPMVLREVSCSGDGGRESIAALVFEPRPFTE